MDLSTSSPVTVGKASKNLASLPSSRIVLHIGFLLLMGVLTFFLYSPALDGPFIFDDKTSIEYAKKLHLKSLDIENIQKLFTEISLRRALPNITFALNYYFHGFKTFGYHLVNIVIHIISAYLFFLVANITLARIKTNQTKSDCLLSFCIATSAATLWLVHPLQSQSVSYIVQRMNSMAALFFLASLLCYISGRLHTGRIKIFFFSLCFLAGICSFLSKENAAVLPCIILLYEWYFFQDAHLSFLKKKYFIIPLLLIIAGGVTLFFSMNVLSSIQKWYTVQPFTMGERLLTETRVLFFYLGQLLYPHPSHLSLEHDFPISTSLWEPSTTLASIIGLIVLFFFAIRYATRYRLLSFSLFWYLGNLFIESSFIGLAPVYEHRMYLPSMFVFLAVLNTIRHVIPYHFFRWLFPLGFVPILMVLCLWTYQRNVLWGNEYLFGRDAVGKTPELGRVHYNFAKTLESLQRFDEAIVEYKETLRFQPGNAYAHNNLGAIYQDRGQIDKAIYHFKRAVKLKPNNQIARGNLRFLMIYQERVKKQKSHAPKKP